MTGFNGPVKEWAKPGGLYCGAVNDDNGDF